MKHNLSVLVLIMALIISACSKNKSPEPEPVPPVPVVPPSAKSIIGYDATFKAPTGFSSNHIALQSDGKYIIDAQTKVNNVNVFKVYRLNNNGTMDNSFNIDVDKTWLISGISGIHVLADGKILLCGEFTVGGKRAVLVRLTATGAFDNSYVHPIIGAPIKMAFQRTANGKVFFSTTEKTSNVYNYIQTYLYRLNSDGTKDDNFNVVSYDVTGVDDEFTSITPLTNGQILIAGVFSIGNATTKRQNIARLNSDGSVDFNFNFKETINYASTIKKLVITTQSNGQIILGGSFNSITDPNTRDALYNYVGLMRLNPTGDIDHAFNSPTRFNFGFYLNDIMILSDNRILLNWMDYLGGAGYQGKNYLELYSANGGLASDFTFPYQYGVFSSMLKESTDRFLMTGNISVDGTSYPVIRLIKN